MTLAASCKCGQRGLMECDESCIWHENHFNEMFKSNDKMKYEIQIGETYNWDLKSIVPLTTKIVEQEVVDVLEMFASTEMTVEGYKVYILNNIKFKIVPKIDIVFNVHYDELKKSIVTNVENNCTLTKSELSEECRKWVSMLASSGGRKWVLRIPPDRNKDPDLLFSELINRYKDSFNENQVAKAFYELLVNCDDILPGKSIRERVDIMTKKYGEFKNFMLENEIK